jgi:hypothetical protein
MNLNQVRSILMLFEDGGTHGCAFGHVGQIKGKFRTMAVVSSAPGMNCPWKVAGGAVVQPTDVPSCSVSSRFTSSNDTAC